MKGQLLFCLICIICVFPTDCYSQTNNFSQCSELSVSDHTNVVSAVQANINEIIQSGNVNESNLMINSPNSIVSILEAVSETESINGEIRQRIKLAAHCITLLEEVKIPFSSQAMALQIASELEDANSIAEAISTLEYLSSTYADTNEQAIIEGINLAISILEDGQNKIYSENNEVFKKIEEESDEDNDKKTIKDHAIDLAKADVHGAVAGAVGGCVAGSLAGGVGCVPGAAAGGTATAIGNSVQDLLKKLFW